MTETRSMKYGVGRASRIAIFTPYSFTPYSLFLTQPQARGYHNHSVRGFPGNFSAKGGEICMSVKLNPGESQDSLLRRFRKEVMKARILPEVRRKRWFTPPSELRRLQKQKAVRKARQAQHRRDRRGGF